MRKPIGEAIHDERPLKDRCREQGLSIEQAAEKYLLALKKMRARLDRHRKAKKNLFPSESRE